MKSLGRVGRFISRGFDCLDYRVGIAGFSVSYFVFLVLVLFSSCFRFLGVLFFAWSDGRIRILGFFVISKIITNKLYFGLSVGKSYVFFF